MNISKIFMLSALFAASAITAEQGILTISINNKKIETTVEYSDTVQVFINADETVKVEFVKEGEDFNLEVAVKNEAGEWAVVSSPKLTLNDNETAVLKVGGDDLNDLEITLTTVKEAVTQE